MAEWTVYAKIPPGQLDRVNEWLDELNLDLGPRVFHRPTNQGGANAIQGKLRSPSGETNQAIIDGMIDEFPFLNQNSFTWAEVSARAIENNQPEALRQFSRAGLQMYSRKYAPPSLVQLELNDETPVTIHDNGVFDLRVVLLAIAVVIRAYTSTINEAVLIVDAPSAPMRRIDLL